MGAHKRHGCLLPLEMYLEEDIPLVCYVRDKPYAEMVELPEQSCHCFMSFSNAAAPHPSLKVCCWAPSHLRTGSLCLPSGSTMHAIYADINCGQMMPFIWCWLQPVCSCSREICCSTGRPIFCAIVWPQPLAYTICRNSLCPRPAEPFTFTAIASSNVQQTHIPIE